MSVDHNTLVAFAKSGGLFYLIAFSIGVIIYTFWPSNRSKFERSKHDILDWEEPPKGEDLSSIHAVDREKPIWP